MNQQFYSALSGVAADRAGKFEAAIDAADAAGPESENRMPQLIPVPIETHGKKWHRALWIWLSSTREWVFAADWDFYLKDTRETYVIPRGFRFDGASIPKRLRGFLSPVGLLLVPGIIHDFGYRYDYVWIRNQDGSVEKACRNRGREFWDQLFFQVGNRVNGVVVINALAWVALSLAGGIAWRRNRQSRAPELRPAARLHRVKRILPEVV